MEKRSPWMKWYPADWRADPRLRMCSLAARGLWIELLGYMHESPRYGYLLIADGSPTVKQVAMLVGEPLQSVQRALDELKEAGVFSADDGIIYSRRMVRDNAKAKEDRDNGKGGGNPKLRARDKPQDNGGVNPPDKAQMPDTREGSVSSLRSDTAATPLDVKRELWASGKRLLMAYGKTAYEAGTLIGGWRKRLGSDGALIDALSKAEAGVPAGDVVAYIEAIIARVAPANGRASVRDATPEDADAVLRAVLKGWKQRGCKPNDWPGNRGVPPGQHGCQVPEHLLREFDLPVMAVA